MKRTAIARSCAVAAMVALQWGCATDGARQGQDPEFERRAPTTQEGVDARGRAQIHAELGAAYLELGQVGVALQEANEAIKADPGYAPAYNVLALVYMELREDDAAQRNFQRALKLDALDSDTNNNYGWFLCMRNREEEGIKFFLAALKNPLYRTPDKSFVNAGICSRRKGEEKAAEEFFLRALRVAPTQPQALFQMADMAFRRSDVPESKSYLARLMKTGVQPTPEVLWLALRVDRRLGDRAGEASHGLQLRRSFPDSRETRALLSGQYE
jgi:type IV pilus assembly protein PilF